jgi:hypothetical protein
VARRRVQRGTGRGNRPTGERLSRPSKEPSLRGGACISSPRSSAQTRHPRRSPVYACSSLEEPAAASTVGVKCHSRTLAQAALRLAPHFLRGRLYLASVREEHIVVREPTDVMLVRVADELSEIQRAWAAFETAVGLRGRKFYGAFDP